MEKEKKCYVIQREFYKLYSIQCVHMKIGNNINVMFIFFLFLNLLNINHFIAL